MFDTPKSLYDEVRSAIALRMKHDDFADERLASVIGSKFLQGAAPGVESHENPGWEFIQNVLGATNYYNPKWKVNSDRPEVHRRLCEALRHTMDRWTAKINLSAKLEPGAIDAAIGFSVFATTLKPTNPGNPLGPMRPDVDRIPRKRFFTDPQMVDGVPAFSGHLWTRNRGDLEAEIGEDGQPKYDLEAISASAPSGDLDVLGGVTFQQLGIERADRDVIIGGELWDRATQTIRVFVCDPRGECAREICEPQEYFGPEWGPYTIGGFFFLPDQVYPFPPLANAQGLINEANCHIDQLSRQANQMRTVTIYNALNTKLGAVLKRAQHGSTNGVPGFDPSQLSQVTLDAPDPRTYDYIDRLRQRIDRKSGVTVNSAGSITGATAQEVATVNAGDDARRRQLQRGWNKVVSQIGRTAAWYFVHAWSVEQGITLPHPGLPPESGKMVDATWYGGIGQDEELDFGDLDIDVEPISAEFVSSQVKQAQSTTAMQIVTAAAPMMVQFPFLNWRDMLADVLRSFDIDDVGRWVNFAMIEAMRQMPMTPDPVTRETESLGMTFQTPSQQRYLPPMGTGYRPMGGPAGYGSGNMRGQSDQVPAATPMGSGASWGQLATLPGR